jgi:hypothetical protein
VAQRKPKIHDRSSKLQTNYTEIGGDLRSICVQKWVCGAWWCGLLKLFDEKSSPIDPINHSFQTNFKFAVIMQTALLARFRQIQLVCSASGSTCVFAMILVPFTFNRFRTLISKTFLLDWSTTNEYSSYCPHVFETEKKMTYTHNFFKHSLQAFSNFFI